VTKRSSTLLTPLWAMTRLSRPSSRLRLHLEFWMSLKRTTPMKRVFLFPLFLLLLLDRVPKLLGRLLLRRRPRLVSLWLLFLLYTVFMLRIPFLIQNRIAILPSFLSNWSRLGDVVAVVLVVGQFLKLVTKGKRKLVLPLLFLIKRSRWTKCVALFLDWMQCRFRISIGPSALCAMYVFIIYFLDILLIIIPF